MANRRAARGGVCCAIWSTILALGLSTAVGGESARIGLLPGEFERQRAILIGWESNDPIIRNVLISIVAQASPTVSVYVIVQDERQRAQAAEALRDSDIPQSAVHLIIAPRDTIWARDYGPVGIIRPDGSCALVDTEYAGRMRPRDDAVPRRLADFLRLPTVPAQISLQGGNLISNGRGVLMTTSRILDDNMARGYKFRDVTRILRELYGCEEVVLLEPIEGESTRHIDMFATFTDPQTVVVGQYTRQVATRNAEILDRNARRLAEVCTPRGPLRVVRIPMPPPDPKVWRTYTNVVFANGRLLVPVYAGHDAVGRRQAIATYRRLLPEWEIVPIDCSELIQLGGALHCITMNICAANGNRAGEPTRPSRPAGKSDDGLFQTLPSVFEK